MLDFLVIAVLATMVIISEYFILDRGIGEFYEEGNNGQDPTSPVYDPFVWVGLIPIEESRSSSMPGCLYRSAQRTRINLRG